MTPVLRLDKKIMSSRWHRTVSVRLHPAGRPCRSITPRSGSRSVRWNPKSDLFIDGRLLFAKLNMLWWLYWSSIAAIDPDFAEVM